MVLSCFESAFLCLDWSKCHFCESFLYNGFFAPHLSFLPYSRHFIPPSPVPSLQSEFLADKDSSLLNVSRASTFKAPDRALKRSRPKWAPDLGCLRVQNQKRICFTKLKKSTSTSGSFSASFPLLFQETNWSSKKWFIEVKGRLDWRVFVFPLLGQYSSFWRQRTHVLDDQCDSCLSEQILNINS